MKGVFITFEGTEGSGKSTQIGILAEKLRALRLKVHRLREPGGTPIGEEIRHTLKHSDANSAMTSEAELLLMNASRAQLVREVIRPMLAAGDIVLCDRFYDSTTAYQGYGRELDLEQVRAVVDFAVGETRPNLTLFLHVPVEVSEARRLSRQTMLLEVPAKKSRKRTPSLHFHEKLRDRMEEADRAFFERVERGYLEIARMAPDRIQSIDANRTPEQVAENIWLCVEPFLSKAQAGR